MNLAINNFKTNNYSFKAGATTPAAQTVPKNVQNTKVSKEDKVKKDIILASGVLVTALILVLARKQISKLFKRIFKREVKPEIATNEPNVTVGNIPNVETEQPKAHPKPEPLKFDGAKARAEYWKLRAEYIPMSEDMSKEEYDKNKAMQDRISELYKALTKNNVSMVEKENLDGKSQEEIDAYFKSKKVGHADLNEASQLDYLDMVEKYGKRHWFSPGRSFLDQVTIKMYNPTDKVLNRYIDVIDRLAENDNKEMRDGSKVSFEMATDIAAMSKDTIFKFFKVLKRISFQQYDGLDIEYAIKKTAHKDDKDVMAALKDYQETLENYPYQDLTKND